MKAGVITNSLRQYRKKITIFDYYSEKLGDDLIRYKEYDVLYVKRTEIFESKYYERSGIVQVDLPYLTKCIKCWSPNQVDKT